MSNRYRASSASRSIQANRHSEDLTRPSSKNTKIRTEIQSNQQTTMTKSQPSKNLTSTHRLASNETVLARVESAPRKLPKIKSKNDEEDEIRLTNGSNPTESLATVEKKTSTSSKDVEQTSTRSAIESRLMNGGLTGLQNLGNTCFMNSVLQCLSNTKPLLLFCYKTNLDDCLNRSSTSTLKGVLMTEYVRLIRSMWTSSSGSSVVSPSAFKSTIGRFAPRFLGYAQQDSQEFLRYLLQGLHEDVNLVQRKPSPMKIDEQAEERKPEISRAENSWQRCLRYDNSELVNIFAGQLKSTLECTTCHYKSITFDLFWDLSIPLPRGKSSCHLQECIELFMSKEELDGDEKPTCAQCKTKRRCTKKFSIQKCPEILVLHLKRFSQNRSRSKLSTFVDFPLTRLDFADFNEVLSESFQDEKPSYNLFGVSNHSGTAYFGHYIAQCKHPFTEQWFQFNDSSVNKINDLKRIVTADAYVLFYERIK